MCGGGGGGGASAETRALQEQQLKQARQDEQRRTIEEQRRLNAVQQINALYGMQSKAADVDAYNKALGNMYDMDNPNGGGLPAGTALVWPARIPGRAAPGAVPGAGRWHRVFRR